jgi:hypothetical protein
MLSLKTRPDIIVIRGGLTIKNLRGILVHQSLLQARLYRISRLPRISEVIIWKNAEPGRNNRGIYGGNGRGHIQRCHSDH